ncbi:hypothetical protein CQW23_31070 [Capsicum baccatum]|uniref:Uncharacterized protein n=1 Tax=Capsicum baccatum TaxID=33114 RepID=A0A2G2V8M2_CAPBA|nr:hypothetical protein CQW23_31070 [Capsicum baccatum]
MAATISPPPLAAGEPSQKSKEHTSNHIPQVSYATSLNPTPIESSFSETNLKPIEVIHGVSTLLLTTNERQELAKKQRLHQAAVVKLSSYVPDLPTLSTLQPKVFGIKEQSAKDSNPQTLCTRSEQLNSGGNLKIHNEAGQPHGLQPFMNQKQLENFHNTNWNNDVVDDEHGKDGQKVKQIEAAAEVDSGIVKDNFGVSMQAKELNKGNNTTNDENWTMVTCKRDIGTVVDTNS